MTAALYVDWRKSCDHGRYEVHRKLGHLNVGDAAYCEGGSPITGTDLERLGERLPFCRRHHSVMVENWSCEFVIRRTTAMGEGQEFPCEPVPVVVVFMRTEKALREAEKA